LSPASSAPTKVKAAFWRAKPLSRLSPAEWESLCDGCGLCCLFKLENEDNGAIWMTEVACRMLDLDTCRCMDYARRAQHVSDCVSLTPQAAKTIPWLPESCAYRRLARGGDLPAWHKLVSGDPERVHAEGVSVRGRAIPEDQAGPLDQHVVDWPAAEPKRKGRGR
jgi:uncharacterized cysteine cluster protein YcgN (CxxCxxCC family)